MAKSTVISPRLLVLLAFTTLIAPTSVNADTESATATPDLTEAQRATDKLREYFEFPRRRLEDADFARLHLPSYVLEATADHPAILFSSVTGDSEFKVCNSYPVILSATGEEWWIAETRGYNWFWDDIWTSPDRAQIWATLYFHCQSSNGEVVLLQSPDGGWTWRTLSTVSYGHYLDSYGGFRLAPDGTAQVIGTWSRDGWGPACPVDPAATTDGSHGECEGLLIRESKDGGRTWNGSKAIHGSMFQIEPRIDSMVYPLLAHEFVDLEELQDRFGPAPMAVNSDRLPGAESLKYDRALLGRAISVSRYGRPFLEIPDEDSPQTVHPFILDTGNQDSKEGQLLKLPLPGYRWAASCWSVVGILQPVEAGGGPTWVVQQVNSERAWTIGKLPDLPRAPYVFDSLVGGEGGTREFHVRRLPAEGISDALGRDIYRSTDEGRTWTYARFEAEVLVPVAPPEIPRLTDSESEVQRERRRVISAEEADQLLIAFMERAVAGLVESNSQRPAPALAPPEISEITSLLRQLEFQMPRLGDAAWSTTGNEPGGPALHFAVTHAGDAAALLKSLSEAGANLDARTADGATALDYAVQMNESAVAALLKGRATDWGGANDRGITSLHWLAETTFHPEYDGGWKGEREGIRRRALEHARFLLDHGADLNAADDLGRTPLDIAREDRRSPELAEFLTANGAEERPAKGAAK